MTGLLFDDRLAPERIVADAVEAHGPVIRTYCLFSGGGDSTAVAHRCRDFYDELAHIDTGTALPGVRDHVERVADWLGKPLRALEPNGDVYRDLVLGTDRFWAAFHDYRKRYPGIDTPQAYVDAIKALHPPRSQGRKDHALPEAPQGFPGPGGHGLPYVALKERQIDRLVRETRLERGYDRRGTDGGRVALLTGVRRAESKRRKMHAAKWGYAQREGNRVMVNPVLDWTGAELAAYRREHNLPVSDVTALIHRSGECNCGAFADPDERAELESLYPDWIAEHIEPLEAEARRLGVWPDRWGHGRRDVGETKAAGLLCQGCETKTQLALEA